MVREWSPILGNATYVLGSSKKAQAISRGPHRPPRKKAGLLELLYGERWAPLGIAWVVGTLGILPPLRPPLRCHLEAPLGTIDLPSSSQSRSLLLVPTRHLGASPLALALVPCSWFDFDTKRAWTALLGVADLAE